MGLGHSPRIVTDGLVLSLDAGNSKNYNAGISANWTDKVGGNNGTLVNGTHHTDGPFVGAGYVEFDGTYDHLTLSPGFTIGTGDFTVECWVYPISSNQKMEIWQNSSLIGGFYLSSNFNSADAGPILNRTSPPGSGWSTLLVGNTTLVASAWNHIAWVRQSGTIKMYLNGVQESNTLSSSIDSSTMGSIGAWSDGQYDLNGFISNLRILKGTALYTSAFTPPSRTLTAVPNTVLLTCQGNTIADASSSAHTITADGQAAARLGFPKSAFVFDGSDDYVSVSNSNSLNPLTNTLICWAKSNTSTWNENGFLMSKRDVFVMHPNTGSTSVSYYYYLNNTWVAQTITVNNIQQWNMYACSWDGTTLSAYLNGNLINSGVKTGPLNTSDTGVLEIGKDDGYASRVFNGNISLVQIYNKALTAAEVQQNYNALKGRYV